MKIFLGFLHFTVLYAAATNAINLPVIPTNFNVTNEELSKSADQFADAFADAYVDFVRTNVESPQLQHLMKELLDAHEKNVNWAQNLGSSAADKYAACTVCRGMVTVATRIYRGSNGEFEGLSKEAHAKKMFLDICQRFHIRPQEVCAGMFDVHWEVFDFIIQNENVNARHICNTLPIGFCKMERNESDWTLKVNNNGVKVKQSKSGAHKKGDRDLKILHITDIHYDPEYEPGSLVDCEEPLCCQRKPMGQVEPDKLAGYWSSYGVCDAPLHMIENALEHMRKTHTQIDFIYHTGDIIPHIGWKTTREGNMKIITEIDELISKKFPGIPVYTCLGNHDSHPSDLFGPDDLPTNVSTRWLYEHVHKLWSKWLPQDTKETILKGGYYTVVPRPGFRIISLNNIDCYIHNWWLYYNGTYAIQQLEWLHDTLLAAEVAGEYVHILAHVPTGENDCWAVWSREFNRLIERFHSIISGVFNGHTHNDELSVYYTSEGYAVSVAWNAGSITTFVDLNPNYRIYDVEPNSMQIVDFENWSFNVTAANANGPNKAPEWHKICHFSKDFTEDLSPAGIDALLEKMTEQPDLLLKYWRCKITFADPLLNKGCDKNCMMTHLCQLATTSSTQKKRCNELQAKLEKHLSSQVTSGSGPTEVSTVIASTHSGCTSATAMKFIYLIGCLFFIRYLF